ncbi:MAG: hypothetical protein M3O22_05830 [Pseudomonadota bacterium]|nr:hypothetical protein [Pseudomonadota bacterium]
MAENRYEQTVQSLRVLVRSGSATYAQLFILFFRNKWNPDIAPVGEVRFGTLEKQVAPPPGGSWFSQPLVISDRAPQGIERSVSECIKGFVTAADDKSMYLVDDILHPENTRALVTISHEFIHIIQHRLLLTFQGKAAEFLGRQKAAFYRKFLPKSEGENPVVEYIFHPRETMSQLLSMIIQGATEWSDIPRNRTELLGALVAMGVSKVFLGISADEAEECIKASETFAVSEGCRKILECEASGINKTIDDIFLLDPSSGPENTGLFVMMVLPSLVKAVYDIIGTGFDLPDYDPGLLQEVRIGKLFRKVPGTPAELSARLTQFFQAVRMAPPDDRGPVLEKFGNWLVVQTAPALEGSGHLGFLDDIQATSFQENRYAGIIRGVLDICRKADDFTPALVRFCERMVRDIDALPPDQVRIARDNFLLMLSASGMMDVAVPVTVGTAMLQKPLAACFPESWSEPLRSWEPEQYEAANEFRILVRSALDQNSSEAAETVAAPHRAPLPG